MTSAHEYERVAERIRRAVHFERGCGFHHWESGARISVAASPYMDTTAQLPGIVELIELGADFEPMFTGFYRASLGWDGKLPVRPFA